MSTHRRWARAYPRARGRWTLADGAGGYGWFDPSTGRVETVDPRADDALPGLAATRGPILGYRVGRRAVVRVEGGFAKLVRPRRLARLLEAHDRWRVEPGGMASPVIVAVSETLGRVVLGENPGNSVHSLLRAADPDDPCVDLVEMLARAIAALHDHPPPVDLAPVGDENLDDWAAIAAVVDERLADDVRRVASELSTGRRARTVFVHGDLHDKNLFVDGSRVAAIDVDTTGLGSAEVEVANFAAHLLLRGMQAGGTAGARRERTFLDAYRAVRPLDDAALSGARRATYLRLAVISRLRRNRAGLVDALLALAAGNDC